MTTGLPPLDSRYQPRDVLGRGATGSVVRAWDEAGARLVALKRYDGDDQPTELALRQRFWRWARLSHPNLVSILDFGLDGDGIPTLVMELADGLDLAASQRLRRLTSRQTVDALRDALRGLAYLHGRGIVHGDVKPANCILHASGLKLVDWGGEGLGTLAYLRSERIHGAAVTKADDLYALAVMGLELLSGVPITESLQVEELRRLVPEDDPTGQHVADLCVEIASGHIVDATQCLARLEAVTGANAVAGPGFRAEVPLIGRQEPFAALRSAMHHGDHAGAWIIVGEAGLGKTRLAREVLRAESGKRILIGQCKPNAPATLQPWREALALLASRTPPDSPEVTAWLTNGVLGQKAALFEGIAVWLDEHSTTDLLIEDLQWADQPSLDLFVWLASHWAAPDQPLRLVATSRPAPQLVALRESRSIRLLELQPLDLIGSTRMLGAHLGSTETISTSAQWVFELTGGNPLHLGELAAHLNAEGSLTLEGGCIRLPDAPPADSPGLQALLRRVAERFSDDGRTLLLWGTVLGKRFSLERLHRLSNWPEDRLFAAIEELVDGRFWHQTGAWIEFRHDRLREALQDAWPLEQTQAAHLAAARLFEREGAAAGMLAHHFDQGGALAEALGHYIAAGDHLAADGAEGDAFTLWRRALEILDLLEGELPSDAPAKMVSPERFELWERLGAASVTVDIVFGRRILALARRRLLAEAPLLRQRHLVGLLLDRMPARWLLKPYRLGKPGGAPWWAWPGLLVKHQMFAALEGIIHVLADGPDGATTCLTEAEALHPWKGHWLEGVIAIPRCTALTWEERGRETVEVATRAYSLLERAPRVFTGAMVTFRMMAKLYQLYAARNLRSQNPAELDASCMAEARALGRNDLIALVYQNRMSVAGLSGGWKEFLDADHEFQRALERAGLVRLTLVEGSCNRMVSYFEQGHWGQAAGMADAMPPFLPGTVYQTWFFAYVALSQCALGRLDEAAISVQRAEAASNCPFYGLSLAKAALAVERDDPNAAELVDAAMAQVVEGPHRHVTRAMWALRYRAALAARRGDHENARQDLESALAMAEGIQNRQQVAITHFWLGRFAQDAATRDSELAEAEARFRDLGNPHYLALIAKERQERWWVLSAGTSKPLPDVRGIEPTLRTVVERAMETAKADRGKLLMLTPGGDMATRVSLAREGLPEVEAYSRTVAQHVLESGRSLWLADVTRDERFQQGISLLALDLRTVICVPLRWGDRLRGLLYLDRQEASEAFTRDDFRLVEALAGYGALALAHAEVTEQEQRQRRQAETLLDIAKALRSSEPDRLRNEIVRLAEAALGAKAIVAGEGAGALCVEWPAAGEPDADRRALADGIAELATLALERADLQQREADARWQRTLAEELNREREALLYQILHDLRNPVQAIALMNMDLAHQAEDEPEIADSVAAIERQVAFMGAFLKQKLDRLAGHARAETADLATVLADLDRRFRPQCKVKGLSLSVHATGPARMALPPVELAQILGNLLDNAVKFTPPGGSVALAAKIANGWATLTVTDTGPGMGLSPAPGADGYGLGNGHVRQLVRQAGGWVTWAGSPAGTVVCLGLPTEDWGTSEATPAPGLTGMSGAGSRVD